MDDKNQNPTPPDQTSQPPAPPAGPKPTSPSPFLVTEEEPVSPPPAAADIPQTPTITAGEEPQPPAMGPNEVIPPVISPPASSKKKLIGGVLAVILLLIAVPTGIFLIGQSQELREKAAGECRDNPVDPPAGYKWTALCDDTSCTDTANHSDCTIRGENNRWWCYGFETGSKCLRLDQVATPTPEPACTDTAGQECLSSSECNLSGGQRGSGRCDRGLVCCVVGARTTPTPTAGTDGGAQCAELPQAGTLVRSSDGKTLGDRDVAPCNIVASFVGRWGDKAGRRWAAERTCQTGNIPAASDGQAIHDQPADVVQAFINQWGTNACERWKVEHTLEVRCGSVPAACDGQTLRGQATNVIEDFMGRFTNNACREWVTEHNREVNNCQGAGGGQCTNIITYKHPYAAGDLVSNLSSLKPRDAVKFCVGGAGAQNARLRINGGSPRPATDRGPGGEYCVQYDIPEDATTVRVEGQI